MILYFVITEDCNLACSHCIRGEQASTLMTAENFVVFASHVPKEGTRVVLSGGEPSLHPHFEHILNHALAVFHKNILITTNGTIDFSRILAGLSIQDRSRVMIQISLDGPRSQHDQIRGEGVFDRILENCSLLNSIGIHPSISTTVSTANASSILDIPKAISSIKISHWKVSCMTPLGRAQDGECLALEDWNMLCMAIKQLPLPYPTTANKMFDFAFLDNLSDDDLERAERLHIARNLRNCSSGNGKNYIYPDGTLYACTCMKTLPLGNLGNDFLDDILNSPIGRRVCMCMPESSSPCRHCRYIKLCNGGCPGISLKAFGRIGVGDVRCPRFRKLMRTAQ